MKTIYIDHNILVYLVETQNKEEDEALANILESQGITFLCSLWNLAETSNGKNYNQSLNLAKFLDNIKPQWILERLNIQEEEVKNFIYSNYYKIEYEPVSPIRSYLSEVFSYMASDSVLIGTTAEKIVGSWLRNPSYMDEINQVKKNTPKALSTLQKAKKRGHYNAKLMEVVDRLRFSKLIPTLSYDSSPISEDEKKDILEFLMTKRKVLRKNSPCLAVEGVISDFRVSNPKRKPEEQDAIDLQHSVPALAYADYFVTNDRFLRSGAEFVKKHRSLDSLKITNNISEVYSDFNSTDV